jgi:hypothetical protein
MLGAGYIPFCHCVGNELVIVVLSITVVVSGTSVVLSIGIMVVVVSTELLLESVLEGLLTVLSVAGEELVGLLLEVSVESELVELPPQALSLVIIKKALVFTQRHLNFLNVLFPVCSS